MNIIFRVGNENGRVVVLPVAEFKTPEEQAKLGALTVSLSRAPGGCVFPLSNLDAHAWHAPPWRTDGGAPIGSSAPDQSVETYIARITNEIKEKVGAIEDSKEVLVVEFSKKEITATEALEILVGSQSEARQDVIPPPSNGKAVDWKKYGIN